MESTKKHRKNAIKGRTKKKRRNRRANGAITKKSSHYMFQKLELIDYRDWPNHYPDIPVYSGQNFTFIEHKCGNFGNHFRAYILNKVVAKLIKTNPIKRL